MNAQEKVAKAIEALVIDQRFYGTLIYGTKIMPTDEVMGEVIDTMATDGKSIYYNPSFVDTLTLGEVKGVLCHEVMHIANAHHLRRGEREHDLWNRACDYAINPLILKSKLILPAERLEDPQYDGMSAEEIYTRLKREEEAQSKAMEQAMQQAMQQPSPSPAEGGAGDYGGDDDEPQQKPSGAAPKPSQGVPEKPKPKVGKVLDGTKEDGESMTPADIEEEKTKVQVRVIQAAQIAARAGEEDGGYDRLVKEARNPREDWREVLRRFISQSLTTPTDSTWSRPNRRFLSGGDYLPSRKREDQGELLIALDTSGSIDGLLLGVFVGEMKRILEDTEFESVTIMCCDNAVRWHKTFNKTDEIEWTIKGGGGTAFDPVWQKAAQLNLNPRAAVYFTDLVCHRWGEEPSYPVLWAVWGQSSSYYSGKVPFGECTRIEG